MSNHFKLEYCGTGTNGLGVWLIVTLNGRHGVINGKEVLFRDKEEARGYAAHCINPNSVKADAFWKSRMGLLPN